MMEVLCKKCNGRNAIDGRQTNCEIDEQEGRMLSV